MFLHYTIWPTKDRSVDTDIDLYFDIIDTKQVVMRKNCKYLKLAIKKIAFCFENGTDRDCSTHWQVRNAQKI
jgi:hypothetical protein